MEVIVDKQIDCVHKDHNKDNAPRRDKMVGDGFPDNRRKHVLLHHTHNNKEGEKMGQKKTFWIYWRIWIL